MSSDSLRENHQNVISQYNSLAGAALPDAENFDMETVMDVVQEFIANPDPYMEAFGVRAKRHVEDLNRSGFKQFPIPFLGAEVGIKYKDPSNRVKGGEAYVDIKDLASMVSRAKIKSVQIHAKFDGGQYEDYTGHSHSDGTFTMDVDYHFEHKDGSGTEEGSMMVKREKKGGMWHTEIKTEAHPFSGTPIIPNRINSMDFMMEFTDRYGWNSELKGKYVNPNMDHDITWDISVLQRDTIRTDPILEVKVDIRGVKYLGKIVVKSQRQAVEVLIKRGSESVLQMNIETQLAKMCWSCDPVFPVTEQIELNADIMGTKYYGKFSHVRKTKDKNEALLVIEMGSESILDLTIDSQSKGNTSMVRGNYSVMGGKVQGRFSHMRKPHGRWLRELTFEASPYKLEIALLLDRSIKVEASKDGESMWTYETLMEDKSTSSAVVWEANSKITLNPASKLHKFIQDNCPSGAFQTMTNTFKFFIDRNNRNFKMDFEVVKDGQKVQHIPKVLSDFLKQIAFFGG